MSLIGEIDMPTIRVDKGIPLPPKGPPALYPWATMEPGDSFVFPSRGSLKPTQDQAASAIARRHKSTCERYERRTCTEKQPDGSVVKVVRIWRVK